MTNPFHVKRQQSNLMKLPGIDITLANNLIENNLVTIGVLRGASDEELLAVDGIDPIKLQAIRNHCARK